MHRCVLVVTAFKLITLECFLRLSMRAPLRRSIETHFHFDWSAEQHPTSPSLEAGGALVAIVAPAGCVPMYLQIKITQT